MPRAILSPDEELQQIRDRSAALFERRLIALAEVIAFDGGDEQRRRINSLAMLIGESMTLADLLGRKRLLMEADAALARGPQPPLDAGVVALADTPVVPAVPFAEAVSDIIRREPRLALGWKAIAALYKKVHAFAMAKSTEQRLTDRIRDFIGASLRKGRTVVEASREITRQGLVEGIEGWTQAYAETVYRTNMVTAYTAGRLQQARDPDTAKVFGAFEVVGPTDSIARPNHKAAVGLVAPIDDPIWNTMSPPLGFSCRHSIRLVSRAELRRRNLVTPNGVVLRFEPPQFAEAFADPGFGTRTDKAIYG